MLLIDGRQAKYVRRTSSDALPELAPLQWRLAGGELQLCVEPDKAVQMYDIRCALHRVGITLYQVHDVVIANLTVQGYQLDGINAHDSVRGAELDHMTARSNGRSGVAVCGSSKVLLNQSTLAENGQTQLHCEGVAYAVVDKCRLDPTSAPAYETNGARLLIDNQPAK